MCNNQIKDYYAAITNKIIAALENNTRPWVQPWDDGMLELPMRYNDNAYQGINTLILWQEAMERQYDSSYWITFKQAKFLGGNIRKGEKSTIIFYAGSMKSSTEEEEIKEGKENLDSNTKISERQYRKFMQLYRVFNADQIANLPKKFYIKFKKQEQTKELNKLPQLEEFIKNTKARVNHGGIRACYRERDDYIQMPEMPLFKNNNSYYTTLCHELTHWTKHKERLNRNLCSKRFGDAGYAMEELVAELGATFISSSLGISADAREDHASYIASWLKVLKSDKRAIFNAASLAQNATSYLLVLNNG